MLAILDAPFSLKDEAICYEGFRRKTGIVFNELIQPIGVHGK